MVRRALRNVMAYGTGATCGTNVYWELLVGEALKMSSQCTSASILAIAQALHSKQISVNFIPHVAPVPSVPHHLLAIERKHAYGITNYHH